MLENLELANILYEKEYFGFLNTAKSYSRNLFEEIKCLPWFRYFVLPENYPFSNRSIVLMIFVFIVWKNLIRSLADAPLSKVDLVIMFFIQFSVSSQNDVLVMMMLLIANSLYHLAYERSLFNDRLLACWYCQKQALQHHNTLLCCLTMQLRFLRSMTFLSLPFALLTC